MSRDEKVRKGIVWIGVYEEFDLDGRESLGRWVVVGKIECLGWGEVIKEI